MRSVSSILTHKGRCSKSFTGIYSPHPLCSSFSQSRLKSMKNSIHSFSTSKIMKSVSKFKQENESCESNDLERPNRRNGNKENDIDENTAYRIGDPFTPMLCHSASKMEDLVTLCKEKGDMTLEWKYDGERLLFHAQTNDSNPSNSLHIHGYTRSGKDALERHPALKSIMEQIASSVFLSDYNQNLKNVDTNETPSSNIQGVVKSFVLDCEIVGWDEKEKKFLPFQMLQKRKVESLSWQNNVRLVAFDLLAFNGSFLFGIPLIERRKLLHTIFEKVTCGEKSRLLLAQHLDIISTQEPEYQMKQIIPFFNESLAQRNEGLIAKILQSTYKPENRSRDCLKLKKDYINSIQDTLDLVIVGAYDGNGKRAGMYGSFLLAAFNPELKRFETVCKIGTGMSEAVLRQLKSKINILDSEKRDHDHHDVEYAKVKPTVLCVPEIVVEVIGAEFTNSKTYCCGTQSNEEKLGISVRFPRFVRIREDKTPKDATTTQQLLEMSQNQFYKSVKVE